MELCDDVTWHIMQSCDVYTLLVCKQPIQDWESKVTYNAIKKLVHDEDLPTLRYLCNLADTNQTVCRYLSMLLCYAADADKSKSFALLMKFLPSCQYPMYYEFGHNTIHMWALMHVVSKERSRYLNHLLQTVPYRPHELCVAYLMAKHYGIQHAADELHPFYISADYASQHTCPNRGVPFGF